MVIRVTKNITPSRPTRYFPHLRKHLIGRQNEMFSIVASHHLGPQHAPSFLSRTPTARNMSPHHVQASSRLQGWNFRHSNRSSRRKNNPHTQSLTLHRPNKCRTKILSFTFTAESIPTSLRASIARADSVQSSIADSIAKADGLILMNLSPHIPLERFRLTGLIRLSAWNAVHWFSAIALKQGN